MTILFLVQEIQDLADEYLETNNPEGDLVTIISNVTGLDPDILDELEESGVDQDYILRNYSALLDQLVLLDYISTSEYHRLIELYNECHRNACAYHDEQIMMRAGAGDEEPFYDPDDYISPFGEDGPDPFFSTNYSPDEDDIYGPDNVPETTVESVYTEVMGQVIVLP